MTTHQIAVIGAGLAGLTTAHRLQQNGSNVHVYEARGRVGGRVLTAKISKGIAELGGDNIGDGGESPNITRLIAEFGLETSKHKPSLSRFYFDGEKLIPIQQLLKNRHFHPESLKKQLNDLAHNSKNLRHVLDGLFEETDPLYKALAVRLAAYEGAPIEKLSPLYTDTLYHMLLGGVSAMHQSKGGEDPTSLWSIKGGNALLPEKIAQTLGPRLHLNHPLKRISKNGDNSFLLSFENNTKFHANILVLAIPCSVYSDIVFDSDVIPLKKLEAIKHVQYGTNAKIMVPLSQTPSKEITIFNDRLICFLGTNLQLLTLYYTGKASYFSQETILPTYIQDRPMIEMGFGDACPPFIAPVLAADLSFATYDRPIGYSWPNDPYAKGSYSYIAPGQEAVLTSLQKTQEEVVRTLFAPIDQKLYFAGEHTSILTEAPGTMEAACESGERIARIILRG